MKQSHLNPHLNPHHPFYLFSSPFLCSSVGFLMSVYQMEKDETVSESSPHIANIGRLVEVSAVEKRGEERSVVERRVWRREEREPVCILASAASKAVS